MDEKKVREAIEYFKKEIDFAEKRKNDCSEIMLYVFEDIIDTANTVIEALEKQLPKKPIEVNDAYTPKIGEFRIAKCPNCGKEVSDRFNVCLECRQNLDWSEKE